jgi:hypothetical protein
VWIVATVVLAAGLSAAASAAAFASMVGVIGTVVGVWSAGVAVKATRDGQKIAQAVDHLVQLDRLNRVGALFRVVMPVLGESDWFEEKTLAFRERLNDAITYKGGLRLPETVDLRDQLPFADPEQIRKLVLASVLELEQPVASIPWDDD